MKIHLSAPLLLLILGNSADAAFVPSSLTVSRPASSTSSRIVLSGYLDDLSKDLKTTAPDEYNAETESLEATNLDRNLVDRFGPATLKDFVDFNDEFDGGDGQMGVAGDGNKGLEKIGSQPTLAKSMSKSKMMSAKNAWGTSTGYADELLKKNPKMDSSRAQQLENWQNQREVYNKNQWVKKMESTDEIKQQSAEEDWRTLAKFGVERNQEFDLNEVFGAVSAAEKLEDTFELKSLIGKPAVHTLNLKNEFMGFADFRAAFTADSPKDFTVSPSEGSLSAREATEFVIKFKPNSPGVWEGFLVIETEDFKKTWKIIGSTA